MDWALFSMAALEIPYYVEGCGGLHRGVLVDVALALASDGHLSYSLKRWNSTSGMGAENKNTKNRRKNYGGSAG